MSYRKLLRFMNKKKKSTGKLSVWLYGVEGWSGINFVKADLYRASHLIED